MKRLNEENINKAERTDEKFMAYGGDIRHLDDKRLWDLVRFFKGGRYLDIGCFHSPIPVELEEKFPDSEIIAIDIANKMIATLKKKYPQVNYLVADAMVLPFENNYFDYIVAGELIEHLEDPIKFIDGAMKILKSGGVFALSTPNDEPKRGTGNLGGPEHLWSFNQRDFYEWFCEYGGRSYMKVIEVGPHRSKILFWFKKA